MRIALIADTHIDGRDNHYSLDEQREILLWVGEDAREAGATLMLHGGDMFERASAPEEREVAVDVLTRWAHAMPVVMVRGNHDQPKEIDIYNRLRTTHPLLAETTPTNAGLLVDGALVTCLPWPRKAELAALGVDSNLAMEAAAVGALRHILQGFAVDNQGSTRPRITLAHAELGAAITDSGQPLVGKADFELAEADLLSTGADLIALGHIHKHQVLGGGRIVYPGSPRPTAFPARGQPSEPKGYCLIDVERVEVPVIEHRRAPYADLITLEAMWGNDGVFTNVDLPAADSRGAHLKLIYDVPDTERGAAREAAEHLRQSWLDGGARSVTIDPRVVATHRVRSEAIVHARTNADRLEAIWESRGQRPDRADALLSKLHRIEGEVAP